MGEHVTPRLVQTHHAGCKASLPVRDFVGRASGRPGWGRARCSPSNPIGRWAPIRRAGAGLRLFEFVRGVPEREKRCQGRASPPDQDHCHRYTLSSAVRSAPSMAYRKPQTLMVNKAPRLTQCSINREIRRDRVVPRRTGPARGLAGQSCRLTRLRRRSQLPSSRYGYRLL